MTTWSDEAKQYFEGYLWQVTALLQTTGDDARETVEDLRQHIINKTEEAAGTIVTLDDIRKVLAVVGTPDQVAGAGHEWGIKKAIRPRAGIFDFNRIGEILSVPHWKIIALIWVAVLGSIGFGVILAYGYGSEYYQSAPEEHQGGLPQGWFQAGNNHQDYVSGVAYGVEGYVNQPMFIRSESRKPSGFSTVMVEIPADEFRGKQVTLRSLIKSRNIKEWAGLWMRIDDSANKPLGFDNMQDRPIKGSVGPTEYKVQLDVPEAATRIAYGVLLTGDGHIWFDKPELSITR